VGVELTLVGKESAEILVECVVENHAKFVRIVKASVYLYHPWVFKFFKDTSLILNLSKAINLKQKNYGVTSARYLPSVWWRP